MSASASRAAASSALAAASSASCSASSAATVVLALAQVCDLPEQRVDGGVLLGERGANLVLLGADLLELPALGAGLGSRRERDRERGGKDGCRRGEAAATRAVGSLRARHEFAGLRAYGDSDRTHALAAIVSVR